MKTTLRLTTLIGLVALSIGLVNLRVRADDGVTPQNAQLIYRIYIPGISKAAGIAATATPRQTATATPKTTAAPALTPTTRPSPSPTPGGPTATPLPPGTVDLKINSLEVTQGIQTDANSVPLVAGRTSVLRAYAQTTSSAATANVSLSIAASRDGVPLAGSPLVIGPRTVSPSPTRGTFDSSFNVTLPAVWLSGRVVLTATVDSAGTVNEIDETNNTASATLSFANVPPLDVMIVPIRYNHTPTAQTYPAPTVDSISASIMQIYPVPSVNIAWHAAVLFSGDLSGSNAWGTLLDQVTALRQSEIGTNSPRLYYALVPIQNTAGRWFNSGIAGIGWVGGNRASVGLDLGGTSGGFVAAHELGHNLGRNHAPCGGAAGADANFPYAGGSIGQIGLDVLLSRVWTPANPDNAKDVIVAPAPCARQRAVWSASDLLPLEVNRLQIEVQRAPCFVAPEGQWRVAGGGTDESLRLSARILQADEAG